MGMTVVFLAPISVRHCLLDFFLKTRMFFGSIMLRHTKNKVLFFKICFFSKTRCLNIFKKTYFAFKSYHFDTKYMAFSPTNSICAPISVEHARKQCLSTNLDIRYKLSCSQALCAHVRADYARARILYTMMPLGSSCATILR